MDKFPHYYKVNAVKSDIEANVLVDKDDLPQIVTNAPKQFGGPGNLWSPEDLLVASVANCFILTFVAIAKISNLEWESISCEVEGCLDRIEKITAFTKFTIKPRLFIKNLAKKETAEKILRKSEEVCLITNSLKSDIALEIQEISLS